MPDQHAMSTYFQRLRDLPFVEDLHFSAAPEERARGIDGILQIRTPKGSHTFFVEQKRSYLGVGLLNALISQANFYAQAHGKPLLLLARYVPAPSAERLIRAGINFLDQAGNIHLALGRNYERTILGNKEAARDQQAVRLTPATAQLLFTFAASDQAGRWTVRQLAEASGLSKSNAAKIRQQLVDRGILRSWKGSFQISDPDALHEELFRGYELALRPRLLIGRFRCADSDFQELLPKIQEALAPTSIRWSLTGGPAAYELQHFYRGREAPFFFDGLPDTVRRVLRIMPDRSGPIILLRSFGTLPFWKELNGLMLAHPWLIYTELMSSSDTRAHEAAQEVKNQFLTTANA